MADLYDAVVRVVRGLVAAKAGPSLYQPGRVVSVNEDGTYAVSINGAPALVSVPEGDAPVRAGDRVWVSPVPSGRPVVHGKRVDG